MSNKFHKLFSFNVWVVLQILIESAPVTWRKPSYST